MLTLTADLTLEPGYAAFDVDGVSYGPIQIVEFRNVDGHKGMSSGLNGRETGLLKRYGFEGLMGVLQALATFDGECMTVLAAIAMHRNGTQSDVEKLLDSTAPIEMRWNGQVDADPPADAGDAGTS